MKTQPEKYFSLIFFSLAFALLLDLGSFNLNYAQFKVTTTEADQTIFAYKDEAIFIQPFFHYNRVQGPCLGVDASIALKGWWQLKVIGALGYGFEDTRRYRAEAQRYFFDSNPLIIGLAYYDQVGSSDEWFINPLENTIAALVIKEDFMDYYGKHGLAGYVDKKFADVHTLRLEVDRFQFEPLSRQTNWALLGKNKKFKENPSVVQEKVTAFRLMWILDWRDNALEPTSGWYVEGVAEQTAGDYATTEGLFITLKRYQPIIGSQLLKLKLMLGARKGCEQRFEQYLMDMGGLGTLVGFQDKEFKNGNRLLYVAAHYFFHNAILNWLPLNFLPFYDQLGWGVFSESGWLYYGGKNINPLHDFNSISLRGMKFDVGFSLYITEGSTRIDFAKRTDRSTNDWRITVRFMNKF